MLQFIHQIMSSFLNFEETCLYIDHQRKHHNWKKADELGIRPEWRLLTGLNDKAIITNSVFSTQSQGWNVKDIELALARIHKLCQPFLDSTYFHYLSITRKSEQIIIRVYFVNKKDLMTQLPLINKVKDLPGSAADMELPK